jgi:hypothetical protein
MIDKLPEDILWEITKCLRIQDYLNIECFSYFREYYTSYVITIQRWYIKLPYITHNIKTSHTDIIFLERYISSE